MTDLIAYKDRLAALTEMSLMTEDFKAEFLRGEHDSDPRIQRFMDARRKEQAIKAQDFRDHLDDEPALINNTYLHNMARKLSDADLCEVIRALLPVMRREPGARW